MARQAQLAIADVQPAPLEYHVPNAQRLEPVCANAVFDGSGAATAFLPALVIFSDAGEVVARMVTSSTVAAGGSAEVTFAPFLRGGGAGLQYDVENSGGFLHSTSTGGVHFSDAGDILLETTGVAASVEINGNVLLTAAGDILLTSGDAQALIRADGRILLTSSLGSIDLDAAGTLTLSPTNELTLAPGAGVQGTVGGAGGADPLPGDPAAYLPVSATLVVPLYNRS